MVPNRVMVVAKYGRHHLPSLSMESAKPDQIALKEMVTDGWRSVSFGEERIREVVCKQYNNC